MSFGESSATELTHSKFWFFYKACNLDFSKSHNKKSFGSMFLFLSSVIIMCGGGKPLVFSVKNHIFISGTKKGSPWLQEFM